MTAILRHHPRSGFTVLPNEAIRNRALSFRAVGVLAHLLSLPEASPVSARILADAHAEGRDAVLATLRELAGEGYYRTAVIRQPDGTLRTEVTVSALPMGADDGPTIGQTASPPPRKTADRTESGFPGSGQPGSGFPDPAGPEPVGPSPAEPDPKDEETSERNKFPPLPPRQAGGTSPPNQLPTPETPGRRTNGTNPRANGTHPRAEDQRAETERLETERERTRAGIDAQMAARRAEMRSAVDQQAESLAEQLALSATLSDELLARLVSRVQQGLPGPLARSSFALARTMVKFARQAHVAQPGRLAAALEAALSGDLVGLGASSDLPPAVPLASAPPGTAALHRRIQTLLTAGAESPPDA